jgi:acyl carrier protein
MNETVLRDVRRLAADLLKRHVDEVPANATRDTLAGWDSMAHVNLVLAIEQHFDVQFVPEEMMEMLSIELTAMLVEEKLAAKGSLS